jgi:hypothetical protein
MARRTKFLAVISFLALCLLLQRGCISITESSFESSLAGKYRLLVKLEHETETLVLREDRTYQYYYKRRSRVFRNEGRWSVREAYGHDYVVFENWRMRRADCLSEESKPMTASFNIDGDVLWLLKDLPECAYQKVD